jgi:hypothetical protein
MGEIMGEIKHIGGRPMVPGGHPTGGYVPVALPGAAAAAAAQLEVDRER